MDQTASFLVAELEKTYQERYDSSSSMTVRAPGRANIIGEHTDYNGGHVLPFAVEESIYLKGALSDKSTSKVYSLHFQHEETIPSPDITYSWAKYFLSVLEVLRKTHFTIAPFNVVFGGNLPIGAGMSSSSAITCGFIALLNELNQLNLSQAQIIQFASMAENATGLEGGKMDQATIMYGMNDHAILLDCTNMTYQSILVDLPLHEWIIINSNVQHSLSDTDYNVRFKESRLAFSKIASKYKQVQTFKDLNSTHVEYLNSLDENILAKRISHFIEEEERVNQIAAALLNNDISQIGSHLYASHKSLSYLYDVSCQEIDFIISRCKTLSFIFGARMMGGGFGGSIIALCKKGHIDEIANAINTSYLHTHNKQINTFIIKPSQGLSVHK